VGAAMAGERDRSIAPARVRAQPPFTIFLENTKRGWL